MALVELTPTVSRGGFVDYDGLTYTAYPGNATANCGRNPAPSGPPLPTERRGFLSFDTSGIPVGSIVTQVRLYMVWKELIAFAGDPTNWQELVYMGDIIGAALDDTDWAGGLFAAFLDWPGSPGPPPAASWQTMPFNTASLIQIGGYTDVLLQDFSSYTAPTVAWSAMWRNSAFFKLEVTYTVPVTSRVFIIT